MASGVDFINPRAAIATAYALDRIGVTSLADEFKQILAGSSDDELKHIRSSLNIPDDYVLSIPNTPPVAIADLVDRLQDYVAEFPDGGTTDRSVPEGGRDPG